MSVWEFSKKIVAVAENMSLSTDLIFVKALRADTELMSKLPAKDVYNTAIAMPAEKAANAPVPYIIVSYDGMQGDDSTKDDSYECTTDRVQIGVEVAAANRKQLAELTEKVRVAVRTYFNLLSENDPDYALLPLDVTLSAQAVQYDDIKPCYWQVLNYVCDTEV